MDFQTVVNLGLVVVFVLVGGVFAATEIALVSLRESQVNRLERTGARGARVAAVARNPNRFLAAVQIGVTVAGFLSAAYGGATLAPDVSPYLRHLGLSPAVADNTALVLLTLLIAYLSLVLGELVPKRLALQRAAGFSLVLGPPLDRFATFVRPVIWLLSVSTDALVRLLGGDPKATGEDLSEEELRELVSTYEGLGEQERRILDDVFAVSQTTLREVMRPRGDVVFLDGRLGLGEASERVSSLPYSRYPVLGAGVDDIVGFLHVRDLLGVDPEDDRGVAEVCREVLLLPATNRVLPAVSTMRQCGTHLAIVVDEYGGTDGIVTLEDLVEEIVGEIRDEYDPSEAGDAGSDEDVEGAACIEGGTTLEHFAETSGVVLDDGPYDTVAGYVIARLGRIPEVGEGVEVGRYLLRVSDMSGVRVTRLVLSPQAGAAGPATERQAERS